MKDGFGVGARRLVPPRARRHHRPQGLRPRHRRDREARRRDEGRRRRRPRVHRPRRPHQPQQGADEIRARRHGLREVSSRWSRRSSAQSSTRVPAEALAPRPAFDRTAHIGVHPPEAGRPQLDRRRAAGRQAHLRRRCAAWPQSRSRFGDGDIRLTVWQNLLISGVPTAKVAARRSRDRSARPHHQGELDPRRPRRLHRQRRLPVRRLRHQAPRRGDRALVRGARRARRAGEHPPHRLPSFLRAALYRRHRPDRLQGADQRRRRHRSRAITSWSAAASGPTRALAREIYKRRQGRGRAADRRAHAQGLSGATRLARRDLPGLHPPPRNRRADANVRGDRRMNMNSPARPPLSSIVPENAPFTAEQRVWLNGFFAGLLDGDASALSLAAGVRADARRADRRRRRRGRRRAVARPDHAARRPHEARRRPPAATAA